jgi:type II secretory pathway predicted ATPase ExeA
MLSNVNAQNDYLLHLIILGQPELRATLQRPELRQLTQRVSVFYHISGLSLAETKAYIAHRLDVAGGNPQLFSAEAVERIWAKANGIPRVINTLCDLSLVYGFSAAEHTVSLDIVNEVISDRDKMGLITTGETMSEASLISGAGGSSAGKH